MNTQINVNPPLIQPTQSRNDKIPGCGSQFARPTGTTGRLVGRLMAIQNAKMNEFAVDTLEVQPDDQALEIGFGHGRAIRMLADRARVGFVAGVDLSDVMVRQAAKFNFDHIVNGRVEVCQGSVADLPYEYGRFTKVMAVNNYQFWPAPEHNLVEIRRVLREGGLLVLCLRVKQPGRTFQLVPGFTYDEIEEIVGLARWVGYHEVQVKQNSAGRPIACIIAKR
jgi:SAM-dependent methyltransferase